MKTKICRVCKQNKNIDQFYSNRTCKDGHQNACIPCTKIESKRWGNKNPEHKKAISRKAALKHYYKNRAKYIAYNAHRRITNPIWAWANATITSHKRGGYIVKIKAKELKCYVKNLLYCQLCGRTLYWNGSRGRLYDDSPTLDRCDNEKFIDLTNILIICHRCNTTKGPRTMQEFIDYCKHVAGRFGE